jgi:hypothetical protein
MRHLSLAYVLYNLQLDASASPETYGPVFAQSEYWDCAFRVTYAAEFMCLSVAKLMVLDRMFGLAAPNSDGMPKLWAFVERVLIRCVIVGNVVGLAGNIASAIYLARAADYGISADAAFAANKSDAGNHFIGMADETAFVARRTLSVQQFCEVVVLLLIIVAFTAVGALCARRITEALLQVKQASATATASSGSQGSDIKMLAGTVSAASRRLRLQIVVTVAVVFVTFLLRAVYSIMNALSRALETEKASHDCGIQCDALCFNSYYMMQLWLKWTPEFHLAVIFISSPVSLLVALWGMTNQRTVKMMWAGSKQMGGASLVTSLTERDGAPSLPQRHA